MATKGKHPFHTILCDILGIEYPIIQGAIMHAGGPDLVAAVSNAGGLGVLSSAGLSSEQLKHNIIETKKLTKKPFAVNIQAAVADFAISRAEIVISEGVKVVTLGRVDPKIPVTQLLKNSSVKVMAVVGNTKTAKLCEKHGVDIIVASGSEAGGHVGRVATLPLVPAVIDSVGIPVVAAGGVADGRGFLAALSLGACGIQMGTRFYVTRESRAMKSEIDKIIGASEDDTIVSTALTGAACRLIREEVLVKWEEKRESGISSHELKTLSSAIQKKYWQKSDDSVVSAGQVSGIITSVLTAKEVIDGIISEASIICQRLYKLAN
jgi:enoyl-[acyl-carrier protein] reductase II